MMAVGASERQGATLTVTPAIGRRFGRRAPDDVLAFLP